MDVECETGNCGSTSFHVEDDGYTYCTEGHRQLSVSHEKTILSFTLTARGRQEASNSPWLTLNVERSSDRRRYRGVARIRAQVEKARRE